MEEQLLPAPAPNPLDLPTMVPPVALPQLQEPAVDPKETKQPIQMGLGAMVHKA